MSSKKITPENTETENEKKSITKIPWATVISWSATSLLVVVLLLILFKVIPIGSTSSTGNSEQTPTPLSVTLPIIQSTSESGVDWVNRQANLDTVIPDGARQSIVTYTIEAGDSIFSIASKFGLKPESVLWANYDYFYDDPTVPLSIGDKLTIPPTDGILYKWRDGDEISKIVDKYDASKINVISWPSNHLDITNAVFIPGEEIMIPGGTRETKSWIQEVSYTPRSGVTKVISGPGGCAITGGYGAVGSTAFIWPTSQHVLSGWDYIPGTHNGIDISSYVGDPVYASDSGTVVYAGWNDTGYGNMILIDHNNGYQTLYGHLSVIYVSCGQNVNQGTTIAAAGSTGKSTGPHLHFEIRSNYGLTFVNPWYVLK